MAPQIGCMADVAMESEGKAAGGRVAAAHLVFVCCVCCVCVRALLYTVCRVGYPKLGNVIPPQNLVGCDHPRTTNPHMNHRLVEANILP